MINHRDAIGYVEDIVNKDEPFSEWQIKNIHRLVLKGIDEQHAGQYRNHNVMISGAKHMPLEPLLIKEQMEELMQWHDKNAVSMHPVERAALLHVIFVGIHPFEDDNGRTSRLLLNLELMKSGFPPIIIRTENKLAYYEALDKSHTMGENVDFIEMIKDEVDRTLDLYLKFLS